MTSRRSRACATAAGANRKLSTTNNAARLSWPIELAEQRVIAAIAAGEARSSSSRGVRRLKVLLCGYSEGVTSSRALGRVSTRYWRLAPGPG